MHSFLLGVVKSLFLLTSSDINLSTPLSLLILFGLGLYVLKQFCGSLRILLKSVEFDILVALRICCDALWHDFLNVCSLLFLEIHNVAFEFGKLL